LHDRLETIRAREWAPSRRHERLQRKTAHSWGVPENDVAIGKRQRVEVADERPLRIARAVRKRQILDVPELLAFLTAGEPIQQFHHRAFTLANAHGVYGMAVNGLRIIRRVSTTHDRKNVRKVLDDFLI